MITREEASKHLFDDWYIENGRLCVDESNRDDFCKALGVGIKALRPVSREQVERMFPGCEKCKSVCHRCLNYPVALYPKACRTCVEHSNYESASNFCEDCGKPLTDEAMQMVMEKMEALKDGKGD